MQIQCAGKDCEHLFDAPVVDGEERVDTTTLTVIRGTKSRVVALCPHCADEV